MNKEIIKNSLMKAILISTDFSNMIGNINNVLNRYKKNNVNNILLTQMNSLGDLILAIPAIREIRKNFPTAHITLICYNKYVDIVKYLPYINEIIPSDLQGVNIFNIFLQAINFCYKYLWNRVYNLAINLHWSHNDFIGSIIQWMSITNYNIGYSFDAERQYYNKDFSLQSFLDMLKMDKYILTKSIINPYKMYHEIDRKLYILEKLGLKITNRNLELFIDNKSIQFANNLLNNIYNRKIIISLGSSNEVKRYSVKKLLIALKEIIKDDNTLILLGNGYQEFIDSHYLTNNISCINLVNKTTIRETAAVISQSDLYIGNDTGLMHIAVAFDKPIIYYICQAKNKNRFIGSCSEKDRFRPYHNKYIVLQPDFALGDCKDIYTYGGCISQHAHCINQIDPQEIIKAYFKIKQQFLGDNNDSTRINKLY